MNQEDLQANIQMYFEQIKELSDLMIEVNNASITNIITIRDLASDALKLFQNLS